MLINGNSYTYTFISTLFWFVIKEKERIFSNNKFLRFWTTCLVLFFFFISLSSFAQPTVTKSLPKPKFFVIGITETQFPKLIGSWDDTLALTEYGKQIDYWLQSNATQVEILKKSKSNGSGNQINSDLFKSLNEEKKLIFKEIAHKLSYIISGQKTDLLNDYFSKHKSQKSKIDFYNEVEQIYFINQKDLDFLIKQIKS
jgi:hypothetical protein